MCIHICVHSDFESGRDKEREPLCSYIYVCIAILNKGRYDSKLECTRICVHMFIHICVHCDLESGYFEVLGIIWGNMGWLRLVGLLKL